jgi:hypothetical protein
MPSSKADLSTRLQALIAGLQKHFPNGSFTVGNTPYTTAALVQLFTGLLQAIAAVNTAHAALNDAVVAMKATKANVFPIMVGLRGILVRMYRGATQTLADFGIELKARTPLTVEQKAAAKAKRDATRQARGTTGKKQKLAVKGDVTGVTITPERVVPAPASPSAQAASNASTAPNNGASK